MSATDPLGVTGRVAVPLEDAALCGNCDSVFSSRDFNSCPRCTSESWVPVSRFLGVIGEIGFLVESVSRENPNTLDEAPDDGA